MKRLSEAGPREPGVGKSIVVIDDCPATLRSLTRVLSAAGYEVRVAEGAEPGLQAIAARLPDMVLTDLRMPGMDGFEVCRRLREEYADLPVIIISVAGETRERVRGLELGAVDFVTKPFVAEELLARVRTHLALCGARKELQAQAQALQRVNEELREQAAEKLAAIGRLAGGVAHDFNNQLTAALGYSDLLVGRLVDPGLKRFAQNVVTASRHMADLTQKLLAFAQQGQYRKELVSMRSLVEETVRVLHGCTEGQFHICQDFAETSDVVLGDPSQLQKVLLDIALNSCDAMPNGGNLTFETASLRLDGPEEGRIATLPPGDYVVVRVKDTGCGMSDRVKAHVFEPFFSTKAPETSPGMSLPAAHGTIVHHGGGITVDSEVGRGTIITIYLPLVKPAEGAGAGGEDLEAPPRGYCVLVVDDEEMVREFLSDILASAGHRVILASHGKEAIELFRQHWPVIDLVIVDVVMSPLDGRQTLEALQAIRPDVRALLASGSSVPGREMHEDGARAFVQKPFEEATLLSKLRELMEVAEA